MSSVNLIDAMNRELANASPALVSNNDLLRGILSGCGDCIKILDLDGHVQFMSDGGKRVMEVDDFSVLKGCPWPDLWTGEGNAQASAAIVAAKAGQTARFQNAANTARGTPRFWDVQVSPIFDADGKPTHLLSISRDITEEWRLAEEQRKHAERQRFLTDELTHRVKNTLATVVGIAQQTFRGDTYRDAYTVFSNRLQSLSAAYNLLSESSWTESDMGRVVAGALAPYRAHDDRISIEGPDLTISSSHALMLALAVNELATNAVKYGALSVNDGRVAVKWNVVQDAGSKTLHFEWCESQGPAVVAPTRFGFGSRLTGKMLAREFGGTVALNYDPAGLRCKLEAPL